MGFKSLKRSFSSHIPFLLRVRILKILKSDGRVCFQSISEELGCPQNKIVEIAKWAIARGKISGVITFDESGFISETELRHGVIRRDLPLNELLTEISKIAEPKMKYFDCRIATEGCLVLSLRILYAHEIKSMMIEKNLFRPIAKVTQKKVDVKIMSRSLHVGENLLARGRKEYKEEIARTLNLLLPPIGDFDLLNMIKMKAWSYVFPVEWVLKALQSHKPVLIFLDENDSNFSSYLVEVLRTNQGFLSYYADYVHLKKRQKTFAQTLLSLLFLESKNIQTGKSFAEDVVRVLKQHPQTWIQEKEHYKEYNTRALLLFLVFSAFLHGTEKERAASIQFLKCMKCYPGHLKFDRWKVLVDIKDQRNTAKFFADILTYFYLSGELETTGQQRKFTAFVGNIPIHDMELDDLINSGLPELFEQISPKLPKQKIKFCLVSKGNDHEMLSSILVEYKYKLPGDVFQIVRVPLIAEAKVENLILSVVKDLIGLGTILSSLTSNFVSEEILKEFSNILIEQNKGGVSVMDISQGLSALFGVVIQKYPRVLTLSDLHVLFDVVRRPISTKKVVTGGVVSAKSAQVQKPGMRVPIERTKCWSCVELKLRKDGKFTCPKNASLPRVLPYYFGDKCPSYVIRKQFETMYGEHKGVSHEVEKWKEDSERKHLKTLDVQDSFSIPETQIEKQIVGFCEECSNYGILYYTDGLYLCPSCRKMKTPLF